MVYGAYARPPSLTSLATDTECPPLEDCRLVQTGHALASVIP